MTRHPPRKILIIRMSSIGDIVLTSPLIRALRQRFPGADIDFLVRSEFAELVRHNPYLSNILIYSPATGWAGLHRLRRKIRAANYDVILDVHRNWRSLYLRRGLPTLAVRKYYLRRWLLVYTTINRYTGRNRLSQSVAERYLQTAQPLGIDTSDLSLDCFLPEDVEKRIADRWKAWYSRGVRVLMAPGSRHFTKRWPPEYYARLIGRLFQRLGWKTLLIGGAEEQELTKAIIRMAPPNAAFNLAGKCSLMEAAAYIQQATLFVSNDSGLMHMAAAFRKPQVAIFGSTTRELGFFPLNPEAIVIENEGLSCRPCHHIGRSSCPKSHFRCMRELTPERVFGTIQTHLLPRLHSSRR